MRLENFMLVLGRKPLVWCIGGYSLREVMVLWGLAANSFGLAGILFRTHCRLSISTELLRDYRRIRTGAGSASRK